MADFYFYGTWTDSVTWLEVLAREQKFVFVIDRWYEEPTPLQFTELTSEATDLAREYKRLYLWSDQYSRYPPTFGPPTPHGLRMIDPVQSGPALDLSLTACFVRGDRTSLGLGWLSYQSYYRDPSTGEAYARPEPLLKAYRMVSKLLKAQMTKRYAPDSEVGESRKKPLRRLWLGKNAVKKIEAGEADILVGQEWMWLRGSDLYSTP